MSLTHLSFPKQGQLGNQMFQVASCIGLARNYGVDLYLPAWKYSPYFAADFPEGTLPDAKHVPEPAYHFTPEFWDIQDWTKNIAVSGYLQSPRYWKNWEEDVRRQFTFWHEFVKSCREPFTKAFEKTTIAIHIRRGDYVDNPNYIQLPPTYYILALETHFPEWRECNLIFFSDDPDYCKIHYQCLPNAFFSDNFTDIADLCLMSQCTHFIIANSSFSWWAAYLGQKEGTKVVRPVQHFAGKLKDLSTRDLYPEDWIPFDHVGKKIPLKDITFTIPVAYDHPDRQENMELCLAALLSTFDTNIVVGEQGGRKFEYLKEFCEYRHFEGMEVFHRTKMLNDMSKDATTPFVANYDCDVFFPPMQILEAVHRLRNGVDVASPFSGAFAGVPRQAWLFKLQTTLDVGIFGNTKFHGRGIDPDAPDAVGGAVFTNRETYLKAGGENERFISYAPEDQERWDRFRILELKVERVNGFLFHMEHFRGPDSGNQHQYFKANEKEYQRIKAMTKGQLEKEILTWQWIKD